MNVRGKLLVPGPVSCDGMQGFILLKRATYASKRMEKGKLIEIDDSYTSPALLKSMPEVLRTKRYDASDTF